MAKKEKMSSYYYFCEPTREEYVIGDVRKSILVFHIGEHKLQLYTDENKKIDMLRIDILKTDEDSNSVAHTLKQYVQSVLRLCYEGGFKFSRLQFKAVNEYDSEKETEPSMPEGLFKLTHEVHKPVFNDKLFLGMLHTFSQKPIQLDLFCSKLDYIDDPLTCYSNLYKIIEFEYHSAEEIKKAKDILKKSTLMKIAKEINHEGKTGEDLINYIVDLRNECDHLKRSKFGNGKKFGFSSANLKDTAKIQRFIPLMRKICAKVIDPTFEILD